MTYLQKYLCRKKAKVISVKAFHIITKKNEAKTVKKHSSCVNANSVAKYVIPITNWIIKHINMEVKIIVSAKNNIVGILEHVFARTASK